MENHRNQQSPEFIVDEDGNVRHSKNDSHSAGRDRSRDFYVDPDGVPRYRENASAATEQNADFVVDTNGNVKRCRRVTPSGESQSGAKKGFDFASLSNACRRRPRPLITTRTWAHIWSGLASALAGIFLVTNLMSIGYIIYSTCYFIYWSGARQTVAIPYCTRIQPALTTSTSYSTVANPRGVVSIPIIHARRIEERAYFFDLDGERHYGKYEINRATRPWLASYEHKSLTSEEVRELVDRQNPLARYAMSKSEMASPISPMTPESIIRMNLSVTRTLETTPFINLNEYEEADSQFDLFYYKDDPTTHCHSANHVNQKTKLIVALGFVATEVCAYMAFVLVMNRITRPAHAE